MENSEGTLRVRKGAWSSEEDILLRNCIHKYGEGKWHLVPLRAGLNRCRKSCRLRWLNYLRPDIKRGYFGKDEVDLLLRLHKLLGNRWSLIAGRLPGRTANDVKNFWNTHISKKPPSAGETDRGKTISITRSNIVRPRPRTFSSSQIPSWSIQLTKSKSSPLLIQHDNGNTTKTELPSSSAEKAVNQKNSDDGVNQTAALHEDLDECNGGMEWWGNLLHMAENGLETPFWFSDDGPLITHELTSEEGIRVYGNNGANHDGLCGSSSLYGDDLNLNNIYY